MDFDGLTDKNIDFLIKLEKQVENPNAKWVKHRGNQQKNYRLIAQNYCFVLYLRQNTYDFEHFSCGLAVIKPNGEKLSLLRYNGANHIHGDIYYKCHIHKTTEKAIKKGRKPDCEAVLTNKYNSLIGALKRLCLDANISGMPDLNLNQQSLFD